VVVVLVVALVAGGAGVTFVQRRPLPTTSGTLTLPGLAGEVTVTRDAHGVPTIEASTPRDLFLAQGYVDAQDRFFLMDYRRHVTAGRLSELVGADDAALTADKVIRTMGWRRVAEREWDLLAPQTREAFQAYATGVNAYLAGRSPGEIAVEYAVLGLRVHVDRPEMWDPVDSLAWLKAMAWDLRSNYDDELGRAMTYRAVGDVARVDELYPAYPEDENLPILPDYAPATGTAPAATATALPLGDPGLQAAVEATDRALAAIPTLIGAGDEGIGSNSWVVSGAHTASGEPILANDPHLSISAPGVWSQVGLRCAPVTADCPYDVAGFSFAGMPGVVIGHDAQLAWGLTNLGPDVSDFFLERVVDGEQVVDGGRVPLTERHETIKVNGGADVDLTVRSTTHGPILSDVLDDLDAVRGSPTVSGATLSSGYEVALEWTALRPGRTADAILLLDTARDAADVAAAAHVFAVPAQNIVFATTDGHIGYQAPGLVPVRATIAGPVPSDGSWPRPGWDSRYDWTGWVPSDELPHALDPADGILVAANQEVAPAGTGPFLTGDWDYGYRAQQIRDLLEQQIAAGTKMTVDSTAAIQLDQHDPFADVLVPALLDVQVAPGFDADGQELLRDWDRTDSSDSAAAAYFAAVWSNVLELTFADDLPADHGPDGGSRWLEVVRSIIDVPDSPWWDDRTTPGIVEGRDDVLARALVSAREELTAQIGSRPDDWHWGLLHAAAPKHPVLGGDGIPSLVRERVNPRPRGVGGGPSIVDATSWDASSGSYTVTAAPSMRMVVDLGDLDSSTWVNLTGTSGHPASPHYADQFAAWASGETFAWPFTAAATTADAVDRLTLRPAS
jgi:penicillin amidase